MKNFQSDKTFLSESRQKLTFKQICIFLLLITAIGIITFVSIKGFDFSFETTYKHKAEKLQTENQEQKSELQTTKQQKDALEEQLRKTQTDLKNLPSENENLQQQLNDEKKLTEKLRRENNELKHIDNDYHSKATSKFFNMVFYPMIILHSVIFVIVGLFKLYNKTNYYFIFLSSLLSTICCFITSTIILIVWYVVAYSLNRYSFAVIAEILGSIVFLVFVVLLAFVILKYRWKKFRTKLLIQEHNHQTETQLQINQNKKTLLIDESNSTNHQK